MVGGGGGLDGEMFHRSPAVWLDMSKLGLVVFEEDVIAVFDHELYGLVSDLGVCQFAGEGFRPHDCGGEDDGDVERCHLRHTRSAMKSVGVVSVDDDLPDYPSPSPQPLQGGRREIQDSHDGKAVDLEWQCAWTRCAFLRRGFG